MRAASALVQGGGYLAGAPGPVVAGAARDASGGWTAPLLVLLTAVAVLLASGTAGVPRREPGPARARRAGPEDLSARTAR